MVFGVVLDKQGILVRVLDSVIVAGFTLPPKGNIPEEERSALAWDIWAQCDEVRAKFDTDTVIILMGDLNPAVRQ